MPAEELSATEAALAELARLRERHGPLMLFLSGGCCERSSPLCLPRGELLVGSNDRVLGEIDGTPFYIDAEQYERWNSPVFLLDLVAGGSDTFSLEGVDGVHFVTRTPRGSPTRGAPMSKIRKPQPQESAGQTPPRKARRRGLMKKKPAVDVTNPALANTEESQVERLTSAALMIRDL
jgi:uncharacterized protein (DUF779 family)